MILAERRGLRVPAGQVPAVVPSQDQALRSHAALMSAASYDFVTAAVLRPRRPLAYYRFVCGAQECNRGQARLTPWGDWLWRASLRGVSDCGAPHSLG